jgi:hypothetical protein
MLRARAWREKMRDDQGFRERERERRMEYYHKTERANKKKVKAYNRKCAERQKAYRARLKASVCSRKNPKKSSAAAGLATSSRSSCSSRSSRSRGLPTEPEDLSQPGCSSTSSSQPNSSHPGSSQPGSSYPGSSHPSSSRSLSGIPNLPSDDASSVSSSRSTSLIRGLPIDDAESSEGTVLYSPEHPNNYDGQVLVHKVQVHVDASPSREQLEAPLDNHNDEEDPEEAQAGPSGASNSHRCVNLCNLKYIYVFLCFVLHYSLFMVTRQCLSF